MNRFHPALLALLLLLAPLHAQTPAQLLAGFRNPPPEARPMVRWWWFGPAVEKPEILRELQQMKADGIGGVELAFVYPLQLTGNLPFLSPPMLDAVNYAQTEARKLGLRVDVTLCSGWPYGGPHIPLAQAATHLRFAEVAVPAGAGSVKEPVLEEGETLISASIVDTAAPQPCGFGPGNVCGAPQTPTPARGTASPNPANWDLASARVLNVPLITAAVEPSNRPRAALFFIAGHTRQQVKRAAVGAEGYVLDPFSKEAVANHLKSVGEPLLSAFGPTPPTAIFSDSLEAYGADWTPDLPQQFKTRRGYDLVPRLPELVAGTTPAAQQLRHDYGQTLTELVNENYLTQINDWAKAHHTLFRSQTYGEPAVDFFSQSLVALAEGEGPQWRAFSTLRWATSANHVFGNPVTSGETFTWLHSPVFRATPLDMKAEADIDFIMGENQLIFHGWPYSPPASQLPPGDPGWSLYAAAVFNDHNPWHPVMPAVTQYITRISWLLRQGSPANQVAILLPTDDAWATFAPISDKTTQTPASVTAAIQKLLPKDLIPTILNAGYNFDFIDAAAIDKVGLGTHQIVIIPPTSRIPLETLKKLDAFAHHGGKVLAVAGTPTLDGNGQTSPELQHLLHMLPFVDNIGTVGTALNRETTPDLKLAEDTNASTRKAIGYIHRKLDSADIYFIANTGNTPVHTTAILTAASRQGLSLDPETGTQAGTLHAQSTSLDLAPYESRVFVFIPGDVARIGGETPAPTPAIDLTHDWTITFPALQKTVTQRSNTDWIISPDTLHYSGEAIYTRDFTLTADPKAPAYLEVSGGTAIPGDPATTAPEHVLLPNGLPDPRITRTGPGMRAYYDPPIHEAALVTLNGQPAGALWHPPYRLDVTNLLKSGTNHIEIRVFNTALNAWSAVIGTNPPRDFPALKAKYGDRFQMQDLKDVKPIPSGLLGPIHLVTGAAQ